MQAIVSSLVPLGTENGKIVPASLSTLPQLNMHVNAQEFMSILSNENQKNNSKH
jgi:hypothetical protein